MNFNSYPSKILQVQYIKKVETNIYYLKYWDNLIKFQDDY